MLLGSIRSISWNSLYRDEEENQTSNDTNLGVPDDIPLLGFLAAWSDAQNKQPDNWRYASSLSIPPLAFPGFLPPPAQVANPPSVPSTSLAWWPKTPRLAVPFLGHYFPVKTKQTKKKLQRTPAFRSTYFPHATSLRYMCVVWLREIGEHRREPANALLSAAAGQPWPPDPFWAIAHQLYYTFSSHALESNRSSQLMLYCEHLQANAARQSFFVAHLLTLQAKHDVLLIILRGSIMLVYLICFKMGCRLIHILMYDNSMYCSP